MSRGVKIAIGLVLFAIVYAGGIMAFESEQSARTLVLNVGDAKQGDRVDFTAMKFPGDHLRRPHLLNGVAHNAKHPGASLDEINLIHGFDR